MADDTDVSVLLLFTSHSCDSELYFRQGTQFSKHGMTYNNVKSLSDPLGSNICQVLPGFHALTGCDYTIPFYDRSKYGSFVQKPDKTVKLQSLATTDVNTEDVLDFILSVVYNRRKKEKSPVQS